MLRLLFVLSLGALVGFASGSRFAGGRRRAPAGSRSSRTNT